MHEVSNNHFGSFFSSFRAVQSLYGNPSTSLAFSQIHSTLSRIALIYFGFLSILYKSSNPLYNTSVNHGISFTKGIPLSILAKKNSYAPLAIFCASLRYFSFLVMVYKCTAD